MDPGSIWFGWLGTYKPQEISSNFRMEFSQLILERQIGASELVGQMFISF